MARIGKKKGLTSEDHRLRVKDFIESHIDLLIEHIERGQKEKWIKPWKSTLQGMSAFPYNPKTEHRYSGMNALFLRIDMLIKGVNDPRYLTLSQAKVLAVTNGLDPNKVRIKKGSKATFILQPITARARDNTAETKDTKPDSKVDEIVKTVTGGSDENTSPIPNQDGVTQEDKRYKTVVRFKTVPRFNGSQLEGLPDLEVSTDHQWSSKAILDQLYKASGVKMMLGDHAAYYPRTDNIVMPQIEDFDSPAEHDSTSAHEYYHWTGGSNRENRIGSTKVDYAREELRAQFFMLATSTVLDIPVKVDQEIDYMQGWRNKDNTLDYRGLYKQFKEASKMFDDVLVPFLEEKQPRVDWFPDKALWPERSEEAIAEALGANAILAAGDIEPKNIELEEVESATPNVELIETVEILADPIAAEHIKTSYTELENVYEPGFHWASEVADRAIIGADLSDLPGASPKDGWFAVQTGEQVTLDYIHKNDLPEVVACDEAAYINNVKSQFGTELDLERLSNEGLVWLRKDYQNTINLYSDRMADPNVTKSLQGVLEQKINKTETALNTLNIEITKRADIPNSVLSQGDSVYFKLSNDKNYRTGNYIESLNGPNVVIDYQGTSIVLPADEVFAVAPTVAIASQVTTEHPIFSEKDTVYFQVESTGKFVEAKFQCIIEADDEDETSQQTIAILYEGQSRFLLPELVFSESQKNQAEKEVFDPNNPDHLTADIIGQMSSAELKAVDDSVFKNISLVKFSEIHADLTLENNKEINSIIKAKRYLDNPSKILEDTLSLLEDKETVGLTVNQNNKSESINDSLASFVSLERIMCPSQLKVVGELYQGEEKDHFRNLVNEYAATFNDMPKTYDTDGLGDNAVVHLHFFNGGSDWYITERDIEDDQIQAYGYTVLNGDLQNAEMGYISIEELQQNAVEIDLYWVPESVKTIKEQKTDELTVAPDDTPKVSLDPATSEEPWTLTVDEVKGLTAATFDKMSRELENVNYHTENTLFLAKRIGTTAQIEEATSLVDATMTDDLYETRRILFNSIKAGEVTAPVDKWHHYGVQHPRGIGMGASPTGHCDYISSDNLTKDIGKMFSGGIVSYPTPLSSNDIKHYDYTSLGSTSSGQAFVSNEELKELQFRKKLSRLGVAVDEAGTSYSIQSSDQQESYFYETINNGIRDNHASEDNVNWSLNNVVEEIVKEASFSLINQVSDIKAETFSEIGETVEVVAAAEVEKTIPPSPASVFDSLPLDLTTSDNKSGNVFDLIDTNLFQTDNLFGQVETTPVSQDNSDQQENIFKNFKATASNKGSSELEDFLAKAEVDVPSELEEEESFSPTR